MSSGKYGTLVVLLLSEENGHIIPSHNIYTSLQTEYLNSRVDIESSQL